MVIASAVDGRVGGKLPKPGFGCLVSTLSATTIAPPLKWAGGKRWFAQRHSHLLPKTYGRYIEPFFGSGALYFSQRPQSAYLSDINAELITLYRVLRDDPEALAKEMRTHQRKHCGDYYYKVRSARPRSDLKKAARLLYLNRTCWNGLYRVNRKGEFNVPKGTKDTVLFADDDFEAISSALQGAELASHDFEHAVDMAERDDFLFVDPPYTVAHNSNGFIKYNQALFHWNDQVRLRDALCRAGRRGVKILVTNAAHASVENLYTDFEVTYVERAGVIAGSPEARGKFTEMVARWY